MAPLVFKYFILSGVMRYVSVRKWLGFLKVGLISACKESSIDSPGLVDFAIGLVNSVPNLPNGQVRCFGNSTYRRPVKSILLIKKYWGLVEMMFG